MTILKSSLTRRHLLVMLGAAAGSRFCPAFAAQTVEIAPQPYFAGVNRALEALAKLGAPVRAEDAKQLAVLSRRGDLAAVEAAEKILIRYTLVSLSIPAHGPLPVLLGGAPGTLMGQGWRMFLVRVANPSGLIADIGISVSGVTGARLFGPTPSEMVTGFNSVAEIAFDMDVANEAPLIEAMWLLPQLYETATDRYGKKLEVMPLSGIPVEYCVIQLFSRDHGQRRAIVDFRARPRSEGHTRDGHREVDFDCLPARTVTLGVLDTDGRGCMASLTFKDKFDHIYPAQAMRLAPDMFFQQQVYRADGETVLLPDGEYRVESKRGPEYLSSIQTVNINAGHTHIDVKLERWIDPAQWGWYSSDTHIHAAGCAHYAIPTEGVAPETIIRHARGEGLSIGDVLTWSGGWDYQKKFFTGQGESPAANLEHAELQTANNASVQPHPTPEDAETTIRYDMEVAGFPSSYAGHLVLLRLKELDYPGTKVVEDWPSWNLPVLQWVRAQGGIGGYAHSGWGMIVDSTDLPNYEIPPMDSIGTQEAIVDVTHGLVDFLSGCDTVPIAELNAWYHMLNCGFRLAMLGETDWPCIYGERIGIGRSYVQLDRRPEGDAGYEAWVSNLKGEDSTAGTGAVIFWSSQ